MFNWTHFIDKQQEYTWEVREVLKELSDRPHLLTRVEVRGTHFPHMAREPFVRIVGANKEIARAWFADVCEDGSCLRGYFGEDVVPSGLLEFGYGADVVGRVQFDIRERPVALLDRERLPEDVVLVTASFIEERLSAAGASPIR